MPLYPPIEPYDAGTLTTVDGQALYWETCGNPDGRPALDLHGGPGSGASAGTRRYYDPERYRIVLLDQRGCGRSRPLASDPAVDLGRTQTTQLLLDDIERLRELLAVPSWVVQGGSWGSTLALAYAQAHPERVDALVLAAVVTTTEREIRWVTEDMRRIFPAAWDRFADAVPAHLRGTRLVDAYATLLADPDPAVREDAAREWCRWEDTHVSLAPGHLPSRRYEDPAFRLVFARLVTHYWRHAAFPPDGALLRGVSRLAGIPGTLIHGRYDVSGPPDIAWHLHRRWPGSELRIIDDAGHGGAGAFTDAVVDALDRAAERPR
ncbi:prolyl aminopeptidase [Pseudonocardia sp. ICBG162]|uniref:prolyl aminopeptidase n=1 Tax=Pseudonocardia sp. ICBG162 TaxID=2846761 RepID=UPI001CF6C2AD|nr:prolyl aminopeptidase [Pseudonocardia sp. ICBG162]